MNSSILVNKKTKNKVKKVEGIAFKFDLNKKKKFKIAFIAISEKCVKIQRLNLKLRRFETINRKINNFKESD